MHLQGNTILITGGTSGIGLAFAEAFLSLGNKVIICGRRENRLAEIKKNHPDIITRLADVSEVEERLELAEWVLKNYPDVNMLINNAGIQLVSDLTHPLQQEKIQEEIETNLVAPIQLTSIFVQHFLSKKTAAIINISSGLAFVPLAFVAIYSATKAAIHSLSLSLRHQLKDTAVKVFEIAPPAVDTELGHERRTDKAATHGGIPISEFIGEAMEALKNDIYEAPIAGAKLLREKRELFFDTMNNRKLE